jgi:hypothetical protein
VLGEERGHERVLAATGRRGAERRVDVEATRRLARALAVAGLDQRRRDERLLAAVRAGDGRQRLVDRAAAERVARRASAAP